MTPPPGPTYEHRSERRIRLSTVWSCRLVAPSDLRCRPATIYDISPSGIALVLTDPLPVGTVLVIRPGGLTRPDDVVGVRVRHVREMSDGRWLIGCSHAQEIAPGELRPLLAALTMLRPPDAAGDETAPRR
jgi:PilZ domain-containing protein